MEVIFNVFCPQGLAQMVRVVIHKGWGGEDPQFEPRKGKLAYEKMFNVLYAFYILYRTLA